MVVAPLLVLVARSETNAAHQGAITVLCVLATALAVHAAVRWRGAPLIALATGIALWTAGSALATLQFALGGYDHYPTIAEWTWLASYPAFWIALMLVVPRWGAGHWLDGIVACLGAAAVGAAVLMPRLTGIGLPPFGATVACAFVIGDLLLIAFTGTALAISGRWRQPEWRRLSVGILLLAGTDVLFALRMAVDLDLYSSWMDIGWPLGLLALAVARPCRSRRDLPSGRVPLVPALCTAGALVVLVVDHYHRLPDGALWLAVATLALGVARTVDAARTGARLAEAERLALTDELTRVGNRRRLYRDLGGVLERGDETRLALFDLNGFKALNDSQGHVAGDALLAELGRRLGDAVDGTGSAYRLGGDEFCVLLDPGADVERVRAAFARDGVTAASGSVMLPLEASDVAGALRIADARMYADKGLVSNG